MFTLGGMELELLRSSQSPVLKGIAKRVSTTYDLERCLKSATSPRVACISWKNIATSGIVRYIYDHPNLRHLYLAQDGSAGFADICSAMKKNSIYYGTLNRYAGHARDAGLVQKWIHNHFTEERPEAFEHAQSKKKGAGDLERPIDDGEKERSDQDLHSGDLHQPLQLNNLVAVGAIWIFGCVLATMCALGEVALNHLQRWVGLVLSTVITNL